MALSELTLEQFEEKLASKEPFVVDFWAPWCPTCIEMMPTVEEVAGESSVPFYKVNIDEHPDMKDRNRIKAIPMLMFYTEGRTREFLYGKNEKSKIEQRLNRIK
jgi:thioredoxin 1